jgi:hypothetical protein
MISLYVKLHTNEMFLLKKDLLVQIVAQHARLTNSSYGEDTQKPEDLSYYTYW